MFQPTQSEVPQPDSLIERFHAIGQLFKMFIAEIIASATGGNDQIIIFYYSYGGFNAILLWNNLSYFSETKYEISFVTEYASDWEGATAGF